MRAFEMALFLVMISAAFVIMAELDVFSSDVVPVDEGMFSGYTVSSLSSFPRDPSIADYFMLMVTLMLLSIKWALTILLSIVVFYPYLMTVLGIPTVLAIALEAGLWFVFVIAIVQIWRSQSIDIMR